MKQGSFGSLPEKMALAVLDGLAEAVIVCDEGGSILYANSCALRLFSGGDDSLPSARLDQLLPELAADTWPKFLDEVRVRGAATIESRLRVPNGYGLTISWTARSVGAGEQAAWVFHASVPTVHPSEDELQRFAFFALEHFPDPVYWVRSDGFLAYANPAACESLGYSRDELIGGHLSQIDPWVVPDRWPHVWQALLDQQGRSFRTTHRTKYGRLLPVEIASFLFEAGGQKYACSISRDTVRRRAADEALQREQSFVASLVETAPVIIVVLDTEGRILRFNRCAEQTTGFCLEEVRGASWIDTFVPKTDHDTVDALLRQSMSGATTRGAVYRIRTKTGSERQVIWYDQLLNDPESGVLGLLAIGQDITEQRDLEERLRQAEKLEAVGRLAGGIAHDFNNQLAGIMGWAEVLTLEARDRPALVECAQWIISASRKASQLTGQLLAYSRKGKRVSERVDLHEVVREVGAMLERSMDKRIALVLDLRAESPMTIGDPALLGNAVLNLALNARDAMPDGGTLTLATGLVTLDRVEAVDSRFDVTPGPYLELSVTDTGTGMDEETQRHIFEPFFTTKAEGRGTGMGLAAVYGTVRSHRGTIMVQSSVGHGSTFRIRLPLADPSCRSGAAPLPEAPELPPLDVVLVDDETPVRELVSRLLARLGCRVVAFQSGFEAIAYFESHRENVDVVILDVAMPVLDGKSTIHALRRIDPAVAVVFTSGYAADGVAQSLVDEGALAFVQKPFTLAELAGALARVVPAARDRSRPPRTAETE